MKNDLKVMLLAPLDDQQTGVYLIETIFGLGWKIAPYDFRAGLKLGSQLMNDTIMTNFNKLNPDLVLILKGLGIYPETIQEMKKKAKVAIWTFDVTLGGLPVKDSPNYIELIKEADYYFTISKGDIEDLKKLGVNAIWLKEGSCDRFHYWVPTNTFEKESWGAEAIFCGTIGTEKFHEDRIAFLESIIDASIDLKIYGLVVNPDKIPPKILDRHTKIQIINEEHNIACSAAKIVLGHCGWPDVEESYSARLYRTLAAKGFYLTNYVKGMENTFKINYPKDAPITDDQHFVVYYDNDDCVRKIFKMLKNEELRNKIAENGMKLVQENHTFKNRMIEMNKIIYGE